MNVEPDLDFYIAFDPEFQEDAVTTRELTLIRSILPEVLKEFAFQAELNKE